MGDADEERVAQEAQHRGRSDARLQINPGKLLQLVAVSGPRNINLTTQIVAMSMNPK